MSQNGRPLVLDDRKKAQILKVLSCGCARDVAADFVGCDEKTIYNTAQRDPEFAEKLAHCESASQVAQVANIRNAGKETRYWRASAWHLERISPKRFNLRTIEADMPKQLSTLLARITTMLIAEVPVDRYRKRMTARLREILSDSPESQGKRRGRGKNSHEENLDFSRDTQTAALPAREKSHIHREKMPGKIPACENNAVIQAPNGTEGKPNTP